MGYGSPYIEKLQEISNNLLEVGIYDYFDFRRDFKSRSAIPMVQENNDKSIFTVLITVVLIGYGLSTVAFA